MISALNTWRILLILLSAAITNAHAAQELTFGVFPYVSPEQLMQLQSPLKQYLSHTSGHPVNLVSAPDFKTFLDRTRKGEYDIILTAPHFARVAEQRDGYERLAMTTQRIQGLFLSRKNSGINSLADLKGKKIMMAQRVSILFQMAEYTLQQNGLTDGKNITIIETKTHNNALYAPLRGEADASLVGPMLWHTLGHEFKDQLQVIGSTSTVPGLVILANDRVPTDVRKKFKNALYAFGQTREGRDYYGKTGFEGFEPVSDNTMKALDPYTKVLIETH